MKPRYMLVLLLLVGTMSLTIAQAKVPFPVDWKGGDASRDLRSLLSKGVFPEVPGCHPVNHG